MSGGPIGSGLVAQLVLAQRQRVDEGVDHCRRGGFASLRLDSPVLANEHQGRRAEAERLLEQPGVEVKSGEGQAGRLVQERLAVAADPHDETPGHVRRALRSQLRELGVEPGSVASGVVHHQYPMAPAERAEGTGDGAQSHQGHADHAPSTVT